jgi:hypothetical protein
MITSKAKAPSLFYAALACVLGLILVFRITIYRNPSYANRNYIKTGESYKSIWTAISKSVPKSQPQLNIYPIRIQGGDNRSLRRKLTSDHTIFENSIQFLSEVSTGIKDRIKAEANSFGISFLSPDELHVHTNAPASKRNPSSKHKLEESNALSLLAPEEKKLHKKLTITDTDVVGVDHKHHTIHMVTSGAVSTTTATVINEGHALHSPSSGTIITPENMMSLLLCPNQSKCVLPELQLLKKMKIYMCKHPTRHGVRFYYLTREGLLLHPSVELVSEEQISIAEYIVYLPGSAPWHRTECNHSQYANKLIVLDEFDGPTPLYNPARTQQEYVQAYGSVDKSWYSLYFKRSYIRRRDGRFMAYPHLHQHDLYPLTYSIAEAYIPYRFNFHREIDILCTLRGSKAMSTRQRVQDWVASYGVSRNLSNVISSQVQALQHVVYMEGCI